MSYIDSGKIFRPIVLVTVLIVVGSACALFFHQSSSVRYVYDKPGFFGFAMGYWKKRGEPVVVTEDKSVQLWVYFSGHEAARGHEEGAIYGCTYLTPHGEREFFYFCELSYAAFSERLPRDKVRFKVVSTADGSIFGVVEESNPDVLLLAYDEGREIRLSRLGCGDGIPDNKSGVINALSEAAQTNLVFICDVPDERAEALLVR